MLAVFKKDPLGRIACIKWLVTFVMGAVTYIFLRFCNKITISGTEILHALDNRDVLFVSNHQTYFVDVIAMYHTFNSAHWGFKDHINVPLYLLAPRLNNYYVAAEETMKAGLIPKILANVGSVSIQRTWRDKGQSVNRQVRFADITNIGLALNDGWVITFPQGTTQPGAPGRRGVTLIVKKYKPIVVPIVIDGFGEAFQKKNILPRKLFGHIKLRIKEPLELDSNEDADTILARIMAAIEQGPEVE
ncbi:MAG: lysophospholipid acyltransferase family protein [Candidatus Zixiibacteriota bacterium]